MRTYELMVIIDPKIDTKDTKTLEGLVKKLLGDQSSSIKEFTHMGKRELSYKMNHLSEGVYVLVKLEANSISVDPVEKQMKLMPEIVRYLLTVVS